MPTTPINVLTTAQPRDCYMHALAALAATMYDDTRALCYDLPTIATSSRIGTRGVAAVRFARVPTGPDNVQNFSHYAANQCRRKLKVSKLRRQTFETAIIERYRRRESSVQEALIGARRSSLFFGR